MHNDRFFFFGWRLSTAEVSDSYVIFWWNLLHLFIFRHGHFILVNMVVFDLMTWCNLNHMFFLQSKLPFKARVTVLNNNINFASGHTFFVTSRFFLTFNPGRCVWVDRHNFSESWPKFWPQRVGLGTKDFFSGGQYWLV